MRPAARPRAETCFVEWDPGIALIRRATVEGVGTLLLMLAAAGSGLTAQHLLGAVLASMIFGGGGQLADPSSARWTLVASEIVASAGLMIVVLGYARSGRAPTGPFAVGAWLTAAIIATPSASYANPAIALAAAGPIALLTATALRYVPAEVAGALLAFLVIAIAYPPHHAEARSAAGRVMASTESLP